MMSYAMPLRGRAMRSKSQSRSRRECRLTVRLQAPDFERIVADYDEKTVILLAMG